MEEEEVALISRLHKGEKYYYATALQSTQTGAQKRNARD
jgi:hypothetical protein